MPRRPSNLFLAVLAALVLVAFILHVGLGGSAHISPTEVIGLLLQGPGGQGDNFIVWQLRLPRALSCVAVGAILGVVGAAFQSLFRNPLAEPFVIGVSSGASIGGVLAMIFALDRYLGVYALPACGFVTGLGSLALVLGIASTRRGMNISDLIIAGSVTGTLLASLQTLALLVSGHDANRVLQWLLGTMSVVQWPHLSFQIPIAIVGTLILLRSSRQLNVLAIGEDTATHLGVDVPKVRRTVLVTGTAMVAAAVGSVGIISFLGLAAPHLARKLLGIDWRVSMLGSTFIGSLLLLLADAISQKTGELPVGLITAILGAPSLLLLLRKKGTN